jgi:hypothetical protein
MIAVVTMMRDNIVGDSMVVIIPTLSIVPVSMTLSGKKARTIGDSLSP